MAEEGSLKCEYISECNIVYPWIFIMCTSCGLKGCGMGTLFVLVYPCFRKNVVITCKSGSFLCSLDNLLQKNVIVFFF